MRAHADYKLGLLVKRLANAQFSHPLDLSAESLARVTAAKSANKLKHIQWLMDNEKFTGGFSVRIYLGGKIRFLGFFKHDWLSACRLADMLIYRLGPMRLKYSRPNTPDDYNFSQSQSALDWQRETKLTEVILQIEEYFRSTGAISVVSEGSLSTIERICQLERKVELLYEKLRQ